MAKYVVGTYSPAVNKAIEVAANQLRWLQEHGKTMQGYVERYGSVNDPEHYGDGGEAIYEADVMALVKAEDAVSRLLRRV